MTMNRLPLTLACWDYDRMRALQDGTVRPEGIDLTYLPLMMPEPAFRMLHHGEFEIAEMSLSWYARTVHLTERPFVAIPVFPSRMFRHSSVYVNADSGIESPEDLAGKRVGCPEYQMTAAVWLKGIMAEHHKVPVDSVTYVTGGLEQPGRTESPMTLPASIRVEPVRADTTLSEALRTGEIDALYTAHAPSSFADGSGRVRRLWEDHKSAEIDYFRRTGIFPIMHVIVIRQDVLEAHPWVAQSMVKAFEQAKQTALAPLSETTALKYMLPWLADAVEESRAILGPDPFAYGLEANRSVLETFLRYSHEQALIPAPLAPEQLFAPQTLEVSRI
ncbi:ABC transporter substrate-binding protein [Streptomyces muensis]|uniref:ABC transporter substrate-binding protein n=1 Tax=Streptomyces muensis TaxID=1077944 RepID=A0A9X1PS59_STRM4|nr:ABC transporter substrate-binding protein [Streptomyces muensis]MCF1592530.1 ABC transporter substrate-binding protein [Streptomyces muensis]